MRPEKHRLVSLRGRTLSGFAADAAPVVVDCGAHKGEFAEEATRRWNAEVLAIEASPVLYLQIAPQKRIRKYRFAVSDRDGVASFGLAENPEASRIDAPAEGHRRVLVPTRSLASFLAEQGLERVDVLKLDIEGAEVPALLSLGPEELTRIGQITVEFHDFCGLTPRKDVERVLNHLAAAGFFVFKFSRKSHCDVLCINANLLPLGSFDRLYLGFLMYYLKGMRRVLDRLAA